MSRSARKLGLALRPAGPEQVCGSCLRNIQRRGAATAAQSAAEAEPTPVPIDQKNPPVTTSTAPHQSHVIRAGIVLSRPPIITRDLTPFEKAYYLYQRRLNERLAMNFTKFFYFAQDTPQERAWNRKNKGRVTPARDIGQYRGLGPEGWNDELLVGDETSEPSKQWDSIIEDATEEIEQEQEDSTEKKIIRKEMERPMPRETEADKAGDVRSLNRALQRTLYLMVQRSDGSWRFPEDTLQGRESLHRAAERVIVETGGVNMNTWLVTRHPAGWHEHRYKEPIKEKAGPIELERIGAKTFFMKGRILAGQADLQATKLGYKDFRWLAKDEISGLVHPSYWRSVKNMLVEQ